MPHQGGSHTVTIQARERVHYQMDVDGAVERVLAEQTDSQTDFAEEDDDIVATDTGYRVVGQTGSTTPGNTTWWGDVFTISGPVTGISITTDPEPDVRFYLDGQRMTRAEMAAQWKPTDWNVLEIIAPNFAEYDFTANGTARRYTTSADVAAESKTDSVNQMGSQTVVSGNTGGGFGDAYVVEGDVMQFSASAPVTIRWNGQEVTESELEGGVTEDPGDTPDDGGDTPDDGGGGDDPGGEQPADDGFDWQAAGVLLSGAAVGLALTGRDDE